MKSDEQREPLIDVIVRAVEGRATADDLARIEKLEKAEQAAVQREGKVMGAGGIHGQILEAPEPPEVALSPSSQPSDPRDQEAESRSTRSVTPALDGWIRSHRFALETGTAVDLLVMAVHDDMAALRAQDAFRIEALRMVTEELAEAKRQLAIVRVTEHEGVWFWQGGGDNQPESLVCPVVMGIEVLRKILDEANGAVEAEKGTPSVGYL